MSDIRRIADLPPSAKLVFKVLEYNDALTQKEIVEKSMLSQRTVRDALSRLQEIDIVTEEVYIPDARQNLYELTVGPGEDSVDESRASRSTDVRITGTD